MKQQAAPGFTRGCRFYGSLSGIRGSWFFGSLSRVEEKYGFLGGFPILNGKWKNCWYGFRRAYQQKSRFDLFIGMLKM